MSKTKLLLFIGISVCLAQGVANANQNVGDSVEDESASPLELEGELTESFQSTSPVSGATIVGIVAGPLPSKPDLALIRFNVPQPINKGGRLCVSMMSRDGTYSVTSGNGLTLPANAKVVKLPKLSAEKVGSKYISNQIAINANVSVSCVSNSESIYLPASYNGTYSSLNVMLQSRRSKNISASVLGSDGKNYELSCDVSTQYSSVRFDTLCQYSGRLPKGLAKLSVSMKDRRGKMSVESVKIYYP